ncbi:MAG: putative metal-binding motif-containing protein [Myxococcales bacterium]|nr:putative metal-binding motif-containing protein [Myxococcales bacterium]
MQHRRLGIVVRLTSKASAGMLAVLGLALAGCPADSDDDAGEDGIGPLPMGGSTGGDDGTASSPGDTGGGTGGTGDGGDTDADETMGAKFDIGPFPDVGGGGDSCQTDPNADEDNDGFSVAEGDCNDCDPNVNPGAIEVEVTEPDMMGVVPDPADENCDGLIDNVLPPCDAGISLTTTDPYDAAAAIGLCKNSAGPGDWGIVDASFVRANGGAFNQPLQHGVMGSFGTNVSPLEGDNLLVLSTGHARVTSQANACNSNTCTNSGAGTAPPGFPQDVPMCPGETSIYDDVALEVTLRAPTNATGYAFSFDFYSFEYPEWVCDSYNDQFIALVDPPPPGSINGNISFDAMTNPVSVNVAFFEVCSGCSLGTAELLGTGFDAWDTLFYPALQNAGATSWLASTAPVDGGELVTIRFAIWDTGDTQWDSTALIDNFRWIADGGTVTVGTVPEG